MCSPTTTLTAYVLRHMAISFVSNIGCGNFGAGLDVVGVLEALPVNIDPNFKLTHVELVGFLRYAFRRLEMQDCVT
jgi:hypothetical protein